MSRCLKYRISYLIYRKFKDEIMNVMDEFRIKVEYLIHYYNKSSPLKLFN